MPKRIIGVAVLALSLAPAAAADGLYRRLLDAASNPPATICHYTTRAFNWVGEKVAGESFGGRRVCPLDGADCADNDRLPASAAADPGAVLVAEYRPEGLFREALRGSLGPRDIYIELSGDDVFPAGDHRPAAAGIRRIERGLAEIDPASVRRIEIIGHSDARGRADYNLVLSRRRAEAVARIISGHLAVDDAVLVPVGAGESHPVAPNFRDDGADDPGGRARNRRVDVVIRRG